MAAGEFEKLPPPVLPLISPQPHEAVGPGRTAGVHEAVGPGRVAHAAPGAGGAALSKVPASIVDTAMRLSRDAYDDTTGEDKKWDVSGTMKRFSCPDVGVYGTVRLLKSGPVVVAFSGTRGLNVAQWMTNLRTELVPVDKFSSYFGHVSRGINKAWLAVQDAITQLTKDVGKETDSLLVCGHSLGGCLAQRAGWSMGGSFTDVTVCSFGAPKWCDKRFSRTSQASMTSICFENFHDMVPRLPIGEEYTTSATERVCVSMCGADDLDGETDTDTYWGILGEIVHADCPTVDGEDGSDDDDGDDGGCGYDTPADLLREHSMAHYIMTIEYERAQIREGERVKAMADHALARQKMLDDADKKGEKWYEGCVIA